MIHEQIGAADKRHVRVRGNHHGLALAPGEEPGQRVAGRAVGQWLREKMG